MSSKLLSGILCLGMLVGAAAGAARLRAAPSSDLALVDAFVVTEDLAVNVPGCDAVSVFSVDRSYEDIERIQSLASGSRRTSPGRLAATSDLSLILAGPSNIDPQLGRSFLYELVERSSPSVRRSWTTQHLKSDSIPSFGAVAILPGDQTLLVAEAELRNYGGIYSLQRSEPPFRVAKYALQGLKKPSPVWGTRLGEAEIDGLAVEIVPSRDGQRVHVLTDRGTVYTFDPLSMRSVAPEIQLASIKGIGTVPFGRQAPYLQHASLSGDGRYLFSNRGLIRELSVADLVSRTAWTIPLASTGRIVGGMAWNSGWVNANLLVVHTFDRLIVYRFVPPNGLEETGRVAINPPNIEGGYVPAWPPLVNTGPMLSVAWTGSGRYIVASSENGNAEFVVIEVYNDGSRLKAIRYVTACTYPARNYPNDILTTNGLVFPSPTPSPTPTITPTATRTPSPTLTPSATTTPIPTLTPSATATTIPSLTPTPSPSTTPSPTPTAIPTPEPIYLPIVLTESCLSHWVYADVALVLDTSTSMNRLTGSGRTKWAATLEAARAFVTLMHLTPDAAGRHDRVAVVGFNGRAWIEQALTNDARAVNGALAALGQQQAEGTRLDLAFQRGGEALAPDRRMAGNTPVLVLLTDGLPNQVPFAADGTMETTVRLAAGTVKASGVAIYTIGIGAATDINSVLLAECASDPAMYHFTPDAEDLGRIYAAVAYSVGCPAERNWGRR